MLLNFAFFITSFRFLPFIFLLFVFFMIMSVILLLITRLFKKKKLYLSVVFPLFFLLIIALILLNLSKHQLTYNYGENGTAVVTQIKNSNNMRNYEPIKQYDVLLKKANGQTVETFFQEWDNNIYPRPADGLYYYPAQGIKFPVKYNPDYPKMFVILGDVESDYSKGTDCSKLQRNWGDLQNKIEFDPENVAYKKTYASSLKNYVESDCEENDFLLEYYEDELFELETGIEALPEQNKEQFESTMPPETQELFEELAEDFAPYL